METFILTSIQEECSTFETMSGPLKGKRTVTVTLIATGPVNMDRLKRYMNEKVVLTQALEPTASNN